MNRRIAKKVQKRVKKMKLTPQICSEICPICGLHTVKMEDDYFCPSCRKRYKEGQVASLNEKLSKEEEKKILTLWKKHFEA